MKSAIIVEKTIRADAKAVWKTISMKSGVDKWFPAISTCRLDGDQRFCTMAGGGDLVETIHAVDEATRTLTYSVDQHPLPVGPVKNQFRVADAGQGQSRITWSATLDGDEAAIAQVRPMLEGLYNQGIDALEIFHKETL